MPKVSFIAPSHRTHLWKPFYDSIITNLDFEVIFVTDIKPKADEIPDGSMPYYVHLPDVNTLGGRFYPLSKNGEFKWIYSEVKPAQCFEIAYRQATGDFVVWTGDDFVYSPYALDHAYNMWRSFHDHKVMISFNVYEDGHPASHYHKVPWDDKIQLTTTALISKQAIQEVGGWGDINFVCGHHDVDLMMRIYANGGRLFVCPTAMAYEPHNAFHKQEANFAIDWADELQYFTELWKGRTGRRHPFMSYKDENILTVSQGNVGKSGKWK